MLDLYNAPGLRYVGYVSHRQVNHGQALPMFEPIPIEGRPDINTLEGWNKLATENNRREFAWLFGRDPICDEELRAWMDSHFSKDFRWEGTA